MLADDAHGGSLGTLRPLFFGEPYLVALFQVVEVGAEQLFRWKYTSLPSGVSIPPVVFGGHQLGNVAAVIKKPIADRVSRAGVHVPIASRALSMVRCNDAAGPRPSPRILTGAQSAPP